MSEQTKIIAEFKECPRCRPNFFMRFLLKLVRKPYHPPETLTHRACQDLKDAGRLPQDVFSALIKQAVPLTDPRVALSVETLVSSYDVCTKCGLTYCTRAEVTTGVVKMMPQQEPRGPRGP